MLITSDNGHVHMQKCFPPGTSCLSVAPWPCQWGIRDLKGAVPGRSCHITAVAGVTLLLMGTIAMVIVIHISNCTPGTPEYNFTFTRENIKNIVFFYPHTMLIIYSIRGRCDTHPATFSAFCNASLAESSG